MGRAKRKTSLEERNQKSAKASRVSKESTNTTACLPDISVSENRKASFSFCILPSLCISSQNVCGNMMLFTFFPDILSAGQRKGCGILINLPMAYFLQTASDKLRTTSQERSSSLVIAM